MTKTDASYASDPQVIDLRFAVLGPSIPSDHGYELYGAVSNAVPVTHRAAWLGIHPMRGRLSMDGMLRFPARTSLTLRLPVDKIGAVLPLAGKTLTVGSSTVHVGIPEVRQLQPSNSLDARLVVIKLTHVPRSDGGSIDKAAFQKSFIAELNRQLEALGATGDAAILGRQEVKVDGHRVLGLTVRLTGLSPEHSLIVQSHGLGGKRRMGCGIFVPTREKR